MGEEIMEDRAARGEWQPIETAPTDERSYLFITRKRIQRVDGYTDDCRYGYRFREAPVDPYTHWQPLPAPPSPTEGRSSTPRGENV